MSFSIWSACTRPKPLRTPKTVLRVPQWVAEFATFCCNKLDNSCLKIKWDDKHAQKGRLISFVFILCVVTQQSGLLANLRNVAFIWGMMVPSL